jgi:glycosyltransferase involved in cell wall biosynthesis
VGSLPLAPPLRIGEGAGGWGPPDREEQVQRILFIIPGLDHGDAAWQLLHLVEALPGGQFQPRVFVLGRIGPWARRLEKAGVTVDAPGRGRLLDLRCLVRLRDVVREFAPAVVHAWRLPGLRAAGASGFRGRLVVSPFLQPGEERSWLRPLDRWFLRKTYRMVAFGAVDAARCAALGGSGARVLTVSPGVPPVALPPRVPVPGVPDEGRVILCAGPLEMKRGFQEAIWALDILRYPHPDLRLVLAGNGPDRPRLEHFVAGLRTSTSVHFVPGVDDLLPLLSRAEVVWAPGRMEVGTDVVLEAMAAGRPVIASHWPRLAELVQDGQTGFLIPPGDKTTLAQKTHALLTDQALSRQMGDAARRRAREDFRLDALAEACSRVYLDPC